MCPRERRETASARSIGKARREQSVEGNVYAVPQHAFENAVFPIGGRHAIAMQDEHPAFGTLNRKVIANQIETKFDIHKITDPKIVVAADIGDLDSGSDEVAKSEEYRQVLFGNQVTVLEPEVEQVTKNHEMIEISADALEESTEKPVLPAIALGVKFSQMKIRNKVGRHDGNLRRSRVIVKG